jgi:membrane-associated phospholipid phosphatase
MILFSLLKANRYFFICMMMYLLLGSWVILQIPKGEAELWLNTQHHLLLDYFFLAFTYLGDGVSLVCMLVYVLFRNIYQAIVGGTAFIISTILTHFFKLKVFSDYDRPIRFFKNLDQIYFVKDLEIHAYHSFPSGHTSAAFCVFTFMALIAKNKKTGLLWFLAALMVGVSRIYLMQHFFIDTYFGAILGMLCSVLVFLLYEKYTSLKNRLSRPLFTQQSRIKA